MNQIRISNFGSIFHLKFPIPLNVPWTPLSRFLLFFQESDFGSLKLNASSLFFKLVPWRCAELWSVCIVCHLKSFSFAKTCVHTHDEEKGSDQLGLSSPLWDICSQSKPCPPIFSRQFNCWENYYLPVSSETCQKVGGRT